METRVGTVPPFKTAASVCGGPNGIHDRCFGYERDRKLAARCNVMLDQYTHMNGHQE